MPSHCAQTLYHRTFPAFGVRGGGKSFFISKNDELFEEEGRFTQKVSFLFCIVLAYSYLCNQVSARSLRVGAGITFEEI